MIVAEMFQQQLALCRSSAFATRWWTWCIIRISAVNDIGYVDKSPQPYLKDHIITPYEMMDFRNKKVKSEIKVYLIPLRDVKRSRSKHKLHWLHLWGPWHTGDTDETLCDNSRPLWKAALEPACKDSSPSLVDDLCPRLNTSMFGFNKDSLTFFFFIKGPHMNFT